MRFKFSGIFLCRFLSFFIFFNILFAFEKVEYSLSSGPLFSDFPIPQSISDGTCPIQPVQISCLETIFSIYSLLRSFIKRFFRPLLVLVLICTSTLAPKFFFFFTLPLFFQNKYLCSISLLQTVK
jgi:hypothetical protein